MNELLYKEEVFEIVGAAMEVHKQLGPGFLEAVYQESLAIELENRQIDFLQQIQLPITYKGNRLKHTYIVDLIIQKKIIVEIKALNSLSSADEAQLLNYLKAGDFRLGLLINFGSKKLEWKRMIH